MTNIPKMKRLNLKDIALKLILLCGIGCFGFVFPDSLGDHDKMVHFAAHFGMSFLIACLIYAFSRLTLKLGKTSSYFLLIGITLIAGSVYKWMELISQGKLASFQVGKLFEVSGYYTSMSQNMSGILTALLMIGYFFDRKRKISSLTFVKGIHGDDRSIRVDHSRNLIQDLGS